MIPEEVLNDAEKRISRALREVNAVIESAIRDLDIDSVGNIKATKINIQRAKSMRKLIIKELTNGDYSKEIESLVGGYSEVPSYVKEAFASVDIDPRFTSVDSDIINVTSSDTLAAVASLNPQWATDIGADVYAAAISGSSRKNAILSARQRLRGKTGKNGAPLAPHAATIVNTNFAELDSLMLLRKGDEAGIEKWKYVGTTISDTRQWCVDHLDDVLTTKEVKAWSKKQWQGKKAGDPFVTRGGWNCRHGWTPYIEV